MSERSGTGLRPPRHQSVAASVVAFAAAGLAAVVVIGLVTAWVVRRDAMQNTIREARDLTISEGRNAIAPVLQDRLLDGDPAAVAALDSVVRGRLLSDRVVRVKVWRSDGTIVYSDDTSVIGRRFDLGPEELEVMETGAAHAERSELVAPENEGERGFGELLEVYDGLRTPSGQPVLFEAYLRFSSVSSEVNRTVRSVLPALVAGLALLFLIQIPLAWSLARRVQLARIEEHRLLRRALEAGEIERRHVAADLHDGVVQSLVGTSLSLSAAAEEAERGGLPAVAARVGTAAADLRQGVRDLRSLIVAIAPPRLHDEGLAAALGDLVSPLASRGIAADLTIDLPAADGVRLAPETETLVYRTAQEAVRNVTRHAKAKRVDISVSATAGAVRLEVSDDGVGFSPEVLAGRQAAGHVGLHLLSQLADEAGGHLQVEGRPGVGTRVELRVPVA
jgi:two-component system NarL family sensor kinase